MTISHSGLLFGPPCIFRLIIFLFIYYYYYYYYYKSTDLSGTLLLAMRRRILAMEIIMHSFYIPNMKENGEWCNQ